jgi:outer membrane protein
LPVSAGLIAERLEGVLPGAAKFRAPLIPACIVGLPVAAADLTVPAEPMPSPPPIFYVHVGALGAFFQTNAQPTGGGLFGATNIVVRPVYTLAFEEGNFVTPNIAISLGSGLSPIEHYKATGSPSAALGTDLQGSTRAGLLILLLQYHFTQFGPIQPYAGTGVGYALDFGNISDGILTNFSADQNFAFVLQAGADWMLTPNWGLFVDGKKTFYSSDSQGFTVTGIPVRAHVQLDPWLLSTGITFKY